MDRDVTQFPGRALCLLLFLAAFLAVLSGCSITPRSGPEPATRDKLESYQQTGKASFYANKFQNRKTANGERYKANELTAAHRTLPFGTRVKVTNVHNGKSVVVRINDRGPFVRGRIIDLSRAAFANIGDLSSGLLTVRIEVVR